MKLLEVSAGLMPFGCACGSLFYSGTYHSLPKSAGHGRRHASLRLCRSLHGRRDITPAQGNYAEGQNFANFTITALTPKINITIAAATPPRRCGDQQCDESRQPAVQPSEHQ